MVAGRGTQNVRVAEDLVVLDGSTFFVSDEAGDVTGRGTSGFFFQ